MTDYSELVKALRYCEFGWSVRTCDNCEYSKTDCQLLLSDAAAAIEELQTVLKEADKKQAYQHDRICELTEENEELKADVKQLGPKRGEWELIDGAEPMRWGCSRCKYLSWETSSYCPRCGAKMTEVRE